ncbi:MAG: ABC transporter ATP-binding protein [Desulfobacteraceae bacterium]|jgi:ABC-type nitrate/sulfonate/bicarbonate transport system ATPase subunit|nr:ABC transporter ATP-binding protein [Desulfobacteraceae bacterium]MBC2750137.1 ABC transporter ATP-binding protein [Desulfobacteraceae bacterium]
MGHIVIDNISKAYRNRRRQRRAGDDPELRYGDQILVLDHIQLEFQDGEMVCILGPSGCGKSTLLKIIAGFDQPNDGRIVIDDRTVTRPGSDHIFVFQHNGLLPWMTVWENVGLGLRRMTDAQAKAERIAEYIEMVELDNFEHHYPHQLSGGMQRRAELARALAVNPELLIMDEPFSGLDFLTHMKMREEVVNMHEFIRKTTIVVTHDIDDALIMGDRIVVMSGQPSGIKLDRRLDFARPRDFQKEPALNQLRNEIFLMLGVPYAV